MPVWAGYAGKPIQQKIHKDPDLKSKNELLQSIPYVADAIKANKSLEALGLALNGISDIGAGKIAEALKLNARLLRIHLAGNDIGQDTLNSINKLLERNKKIAELWEKIKSFAPPFFLHLGTYFDQLVPDAKLKVLQNLLEMHQITEKST